MEFTPDKKYLIMDCKKCFAKDVPHFLSVSSRCRKCEMIRQHTSRAKRKEEILKAKDAFMRNE